MEGAVLFISFHIEIRVVYGSLAQVELIRIILKRTMKSLKHQRLSINLQNCASIISYYIIIVFKKMCFYMGGNFKNEN